MKFVFIPCGMELTPKRISIFSENIRKRGGNIFQLDDFTFDWKQEEKTNLFLLTSQEITQTVQSQKISQVHYFHSFCRMYFLQQACQVTNLLLTVSGLRPVSKRINSWNITLSVNTDLFLNISSVSSHNLVRESNKT